MTTRKKDGVDERYEREIAEWIRRNKQETTAPDLIDAERPFVPPMRGWPTAPERKIP